MIIEMKAFSPEMMNKVLSYNLSKQVLVSATTGLLCLCGGFPLGHSAVLVPQIKDDPEFPYEDHYDSWIAAVAPLSMAFGCMFAGVLSDRLGRRFTHILLLWPFLIGYLVLAFTKNVTYLLLGRFLTAMCTGVFRSAGAVFMVEVSDPKPRPIFQLILSLAGLSGILISHIIGRYLDQKHSSLVFSSPIFVAFIILIFLKESPLWLISKGRIEEGVESFNWYRSKIDASQKELAQVLQKQENKVDNLSFVDTLRIIFSKKFLKGYTAGFFLFATIQFCGLNNLIFYAQDLLNPTFSGQINGYLLMIIVDTLRLVGTIGLVPVLKYCPRRKSFFVITSIVIFLLIGIIVYLIINPVGLMWVLLICLISYTLVGGIMTSLAWTFVAELFPNEIRGIGLGMGTTTSYLLLFVSVKTTPGIMESFGVTAVYTTFVVVTSVSLIALHFLLPDTDGKPLHEIEDNLNTKNMIKGILS